MEDKKNNELDNTKNEGISENSTIESKSVTREINLDELYDGAINNTVLIDPITKDEVLLETKKSNNRIFGILVAVLILLVLYFVNNKMDIDNNDANVVPVTTTTTTAKTEYKTGILTCTYSSSSSSDTQKATYTSEYEDIKILNSNFNFDVVLLTETASESVLDLMKEYENFFINNASLGGANISFEKDDKGFAFSSKVDYNNVNFDKFSYSEDQTKLYTKPSSSDTLESVKLAYENKGYTCTISTTSNE